MGVGEVWRIEAEAVAALRGAMTGNTMEMIPCLKISDEQMVLGPRGRSQVTQMFDEFRGEKGRKIREPVELQSERQLFDSDGSGNLRQRESRGKSGSWWREGNACASIGRESEGNEDLVREFRGCKGN